MRYTTTKNTQKSFWLVIALCLVTLSGVVMVSFQIANNNVSAKSNKDDKFNAAYALAAHPAAIAEVYRAFSTIGISKGESYIPQPKDMTGFRFDARRLIFGNVGDTLKFEIVTAPAGVNLTKTKAIYTTSNANVATVAQDGTVTATGLGKCTISGQIGELKTSSAVVVAKKWVALTFDDGPGKDTPRLLKALRERDINSTFFIVGSNGASKGGQEKLKTMAADGNEIANHTYNHDSSPANILKGLAKTDNVIKKAIGKPAALMRPPGGAINANTRKCGKPIIMWNVDPKDWQNRNADYVFNYIMKHASSGDIILLHDIHKTSVDAGIRVFDALEAKGYTFVTVSQILEDPVAGENYNKGSKAVRTMKIMY